jgi:4-amino-4-deoxy-L-arabinose transferase-like glycosyltransferase
MEMRDKTYLWLGLILFFAVLARVAVALYLGDVVDAPHMLTDQRSYHALGARLVEGHGYSFDQGWYPFTPADTPTAHWSFLYSLFVAAVYAVFGVHPLAVRLVQAVLGGVLLPLMVYRLARQIMSWAPPDPCDAEDTPNLLYRRVGKGHAIPLIAAAIAGVYGYFVLYAATLMTETFYIVILLWSLEVGLRAGACWRDGKKIPITLTLQLGLSLGLAALLRQSILPWVPVLCLWLLWTAWRGQRLKHAVKTLVLVGFVLLVFILPWTYRNYQVYGDFLLLNSNAGFAMFSAQHPMHGVSFREFDAAPLPEGWWGRSEAELDKDLMRLGIEFVLDDPIRYSLLSLSRVRAFFEFWPTQDTTLLNNLGRTASFGLFLPLILFGLYLVIRDKNFVERNTLVFLFIVFYTLLHVLTWAMVRYRLPVDAVLVILAALALLELYTRGRRWLSARSIVPMPVQSYAATSPRRKGNLLDE